MADKRYINEVLTDNETVISQFGYHWTRYVKPKYIFVHMIPVIVSLIVGFGIASIPDLLSIGISVGMFLWWGLEVLIWIIITSDVRIVTNKRVILKEGFFARKTQELKLSAIEAIEFDQSAFERLLKVGCLQITGRGGGTVINFHHVSKPIKTKYMIENIDWEDASFDANRSS